ncbi:hypothetical protein V5O48_004056 [Marasmius crinis-equi]|uniref:Mitochondrial outer membrane transport complex Sam37/metaxin N-terminal domain-containing protein n=1 Tax=Marasmius crinis-equi TaxID=585013 RepID=A0ABR3FR65_9AGAR
MQSKLKLHIWPGKWTLPSWDPSCLAAVMFLQLSAPGLFSLVEDCNPDASTTGQFPYLQHGDGDDEQIYAPLSSIIQHVLSLSLPGVKSTSFAAGAPSQTAWITYAESALGDLVANTFYALPTNWNSLTHPTLVETFPIPQRFYSPFRIRDTYKQRLEAVDLWCLSGVELEEEAKKKSGSSFRENGKGKEKEKEEDFNPRYVFAKVFEREKITEKARSTFTLLSRLLGSNPFFGDDDGSEPTLLDITIAAHILLLLVPPFPDPLLRDLLNKSFPDLVAHAERMRKLTLDTPGFPKAKKGDGEENGDVWLTRLRFGFFGIAVGGFAAHAYSVYSK